MTTAQAAALSTRTAQARPRIGESRRGTDTDVPPPSDRRRPALRRCPGFGRSTTADAYRARQKGPRSLPPHRRRLRQRNPATTQIPTTDRREPQAGQRSPALGAAQPEAVPSDRTESID